MLIRILACLAISVTISLAAGCGRSDAPTEESASVGVEPQAHATAPRPEPAGPPLVEVDTSLGKVTIELEPDKAPLTVDNFLHYVDRGQYNGTIFHQVARGVAALGGGYSPELVARPANSSVRNEADASAKNRRGTIAMARNPDVIDSATSQFFFNLADNPELDHKGPEAPQYGYCVFGHVTSGQDVLDRLNAVPVEDKPNFQQLPAQAVLINSVRRLR